MTHLPFFSRAGQRERLTSALGVLAIATGFRKGRIRATPKLGIFQRPLEFAAARPFTTALVGAGLAAPKLALQAIKGGIPVAGKFLFGSPKRALITTAAAGILQASPIVRKTAFKTISDPTAGGRAIGGFIERTIGKEVRRKPKGAVQKALELGGAGGLVAAGAVLGIKALKKRKGAITQAVPLLAAPALPLQAQVVPATIIPAIATPGAVKEKPKKAKRIRSQKAGLSPVFINQIQISN